MKSKKAKNKKKKMIIIELILSLRSHLFECIFFPLSSFSFNNQQIVYLLLSKYDKYGKLTKKESILLCVRLVISIHSKLIMYTHFPIILHKGNKNSWSLWKISSNSEYTHAMFISIQLKTKWVPEISFFLSA